MKELDEILAEMQTKIKAPKNQQGQGVKYKYRSNEAILEAVKPLLQGAILTQTDEIVLIGNRYYVKAATSLRSGFNSITAIGYARESETSRTGLDLAQLTGSCSSYARKYSISGLLLIDDNKDPDALADQKTVVKMPKRADVNKALGACKTNEEYRKIRDGFLKKYGNIYENFSGNPQNKRETWLALFGTHQDRILGNPPVPASQTPDDLQKSFDNLVDSADSWASYDFVADMLEKNPALDNQKNIDAVLELEHDLAERLGARE